MTNGWPAILLLAAVTASPPKKAPVAPAKPSVPPLGRMPRLPPRNAPTPPFTTNLSLSLHSAAGDAKIEATPGQVPSDKRENVNVKPGEKPQIRWQVKNVDPKLAVRNVVVHFLVHRQSQPGEAIPAGPRKGSWMDTVLGTDISVKQSVTGASDTAIYEPGCYLVELELLDEEGKRRNYCLLEMRVTQ